MFPTPVRLGCPNDAHLNLSHLQVSRMSETVISPMMLSGLEPVT
ncbi:MAG: hypothetical protein RIR09_2448, partial [Pseudomonadota bacterium]